LLVVEDSPINQQVVVEFLETAGFQVDVAGDGEEGFTARFRHDYALVLMDCQMPVMDGFAATRAIRSRELASGQPRIPIVALTANALPSDREKCLAAEMDDYVSKPFKRDNLLQALNRWAAPGRPPQG
jgi:CheY-like chemotaxis protein